jgi:hypothetical protein
MDTKRIINIAAAVAAALAVEAEKPSNSLQAGDVQQIAAPVTKKVEEKVEQQIKPVVDVLTNKEPFYMSVQWWTQMMGLLAVILGIFEISFPAELQAQTVAVIMTVVGAGVSVAMFFNRYIRPSGLLRKLRGE